MEQFENIGYGVEPFQTYTYHQQIDSQHLPGCQNPFQPLEQCAHCLPAYLDASSPRSLRSQGGSYQTQEQNAPGYSTGLAPRTWAEVAGTPPVSHTRLYSGSDNGMSLPDSAGLVSLQYGTIDMGIALGHETAQRRTYAEVAQQHTRLQSCGENTRLHPLDHFRRPSNAYRSHILGGDGFGQRSPPPPRSNGMQSQLGHLAIGFPQQQVCLTPSDNPPLRFQRGNLSSPKTTVDPRNITNFVQATQYGGHRVPLRSNTNVALSSPASPHTHSVASSSQSKPSSRRKGDEMRDPSLPHRCLECRKTFVKQEDLRRHVHRSHAHVADRPYKCTKQGCPWAFVNPKDLRRHEGTHNPEQERHKCPHFDCDKSYTRPDNLRRHFSKDHQEDSTYMSWGNSMSRSTSQTSYSQPYLGSESET